MSQSEGRDPQDMVEAGREAVDNVYDEAAQAAEAQLGHAELDLNDDDRLPWLESADDDYDEEGVDGARVFGFILAGVLALGVLVGGIWWFTHRPDPDMVADGSTIPAPEVPYKEAPKDPGGKTFAGTGDTSYAVSQGQDRQAKLAGGGEVPRPSVDAGTAPAPAAAGAAAPAAPSGGVGVQVGAFGSKEAAEAGWAKLAGRSDVLKGVSHRVIEGQADIGKVYRLQAVAGDAAGADALCGRLKAVGISCQVKK
jgi:hypothetical protein